MLVLEIPEREYFDSVKQEFVYLKKQKLVLEHSLLSVSRWEAKWKKPFLSNERKSYEESIDYIRCMSLSNDVSDSVVYGVDEKTLNKVSDYIEDSMTATWFNDSRQKKSSRGQVVTSELIYYWMVAFQIPFEAQKWHLNRLLTLIRICEIKNAPPKKMKKKDIYARNKALNAARRNNLGTNG